MRPGALDRAASLRSYHSIWLALYPCTHMVELFVWVAVGAVAGTWIGVYRCSDVSKAPLRFGNVAHLFACGAVGALAGSLLFSVLARFFYDLKPFSN